MDELNICFFFKDFILFVCVCVFARIYLLYA